MKIHLITLCKNIPKWVNEGYQDYAKRLPKECALVLHELPLPRRYKSSVVNQLKQQEATLIVNAIPAHTHIIALDEQGEPWSTQQLSADLAAWCESRENITLIIGGPDGLDPSILQKAHRTHSLSALTLPHPLVRILIVEQLYRAWSILKNHPYHRG